jgi:hypothetical protein
MSRIRSRLVATSLLAAGSLALPAGAYADAPVSASGQFEAQANLDTAAALAVAGHSAARARALVARAESAFDRAAQLTLKAEADASAAATQFADAVKADGAKLVALASATRGKLKAAAVSALSHNMSLAARVSSKLAGDAQTAAASGDASASSTGGDVQQQLAATSELINTAQSLDLAGKAKAVIARGIADEQSAKARLTQALDALGQPASASVSTSGDGHSSGPSNQPSNQPPIPMQGEVGISVTGRIASNG